MPHSSLVVGATGMVGCHIARQLSLRGTRPIALSRKPQHSNDARWITGDLHEPAKIPFPEFEILYCTANVGSLVPALPYLVRPSLKRIVALTSTSILTKTNSDDAEEKAAVLEFAASEARFIEACRSLKISWTVLRPTLIYDEGRDVNISRLADLIRKIGFIPLYGSARGLRQPVHAEDVAIGAINAASSSAAANKIYELPGGETMAYREMVGRVFDGMNRRRVAISIPPVIWRTAFHLARSHLPRANAAMGIRMGKDLVFDSTEAQRDFGWRPRAFRPKFTDA
jgi:nucleoside-diphosphate-sugar epimerase